MDDDLRRRSEGYIDGLFGEGAGEKHSRFLERLDNAALREMLHRCHVLESDTSVLSIEENYLIGMCVLCAARSYAPASMFAKTLLHIGVDERKILEAVARLSMWTGGVPAAEAAAHIQRAVGEYREKGRASLDAWFPPEEPGPREPRGGNVG